MQRRQTIARTAAIGCLVAATAQLRAQEWEEYSPYYEDDAWYDITEWFDGNDYNPVDEYPGQPDETDLEFDTWNDSETWGADSPYRGADHTDGWWGYDHRYDTDDWFYDWYDDGHLTYVTGGGGIQPYAWSYHDYDQDGFYDAYSLYRDTDGDGLYDDFDYFPLHSGADVSQQDQRTSGQQSGQQPRRLGQQRTGRSQPGQQRTGQQRTDQQRTGQQARQQQPSDRAGQQQTQRQPQSTSGRQRVVARSSKQWQVSGTVANTKLVRVRDQEHRIVRLQTADGRNVIADLGPQSGLRDLQLRSGERITVHGAMKMVGDKDVLFAQRISAGGQTQQIDRRGARLDGTLAGVRRFQVRGDQRQLAILDTGGDKWLLDFGRASDVRAELERGQQLTVRGVPTLRDGQRLLLVTSFQSNGQQHRVERRPDQARQETRRQSRPSDSGQGVQSRSGSRRSG